MSSNPPIKIIFTWLVPGNVLLEAIDRSTRPNEFVADDFRGGIVVGQQSTNKRENMRVYPNGEDVLYLNRSYGEIHIYKYDWIQGKRLTTRNRERNALANKIIKYLKNKGYSSL